MLQRIHAKLGTAGFVISIVALVAALGGGAYAASGGLTGKQKNEVEKIAKKYAGKNGAAGPAGATGAAGPAGAKGDVGAGGANGASGAPGASGKEGSPWTAGGVLPSGKTETGYWALVAAGTNGFTGTAISFPIPLKEGGAEESAFGFTLAHTQNNEFGTSGCTGSAEKPTAPPGVLCVYTAFDETSGAITPRLEVKSFQNNEPTFESYGPSGAFLEGPNVATGQKQFTWGTWAVTAP